MRRYRTLRAFTKFGTAIAIGAGISVPALALLAMAATVWSWLIFIASIVVGCLAGFLLQVLVDLARVIVDMLLPNEEYSSPPQE
jgi:putative flippase GtrA